ncbi:MAG: hypothetical protein PUA88_05950 [Bacillales bacterium]|nr:hypothetical protein [Bacillales bacterium]
MKKSKIAVLVLSLGLLMGGISNVQTANNNLNFDKSVLKLNEETETPYKTVLFGTAYNSEEINSYTSSWSTTNDGFTCNIVNASNYNNAWEYIKMGTSGSITTDSYIDKAITSVTLSVTAITASNIKSITLKVSNENTFPSGSTTSISLDKSKFVKGDMEIAVPTPEENKFYQIAIEATSTKQISISKITFNISKSDSNPAEEIKKEETKAQLQYSFETTGKVLEKTYVEVTEAQVDWSGDYLIGYKVSDTEAYVFNSSLSKIDVAQNYVTLPVINGKIKSSTTNDAYKFTISAVTGGYSIKSSSGLYIGNSTTGNALETTSAEASAYVNTISFDTKAVIKSGSTSLQFNSGTSPRFRYYGSTQKPITLFKCVDTNKNVYSFSNMKMNFGAIIKKSILEDLSTKATITKYGIAVAQKSKIDADLEVSSVAEALSASKDYVTKIDQTYNPETLTLTDETGTANNGDYVIFSTNLKYPEGTTKYTDVVNAVAYFVVNGSYVVLKEKSCSVSSLADEYVASEAFSSFTVYAQESLMALGALND